MQLKTGILFTPSPRLLDVLNSFLERKNVRLTEALKVSLILMQPAMQPIEPVVKHL